MVLGGDIGTIIDDEEDEVKLNILEYSGDVIYTKELDKEMILPKGETIELAITIPKDYDEEEIDIIVLDEDIAIFDKLFNQLITKEVGKTEVSVMYKGKELQRYVILIN